MEFNMQKSSDDITLTAVKQLISYCQDIQKILQADQQLFIDNDLPGLIASNQQKNLLLERMMAQKDIITRSTNNINKHPNSNNILTQLKTELASCYQSTIINYQVVFANLMHLKSIWDQLLAAQEKPDRVYDHTGSLNK
jgi:hypothetical protein